MNEDKKVWNKQQENILKSWGEASACYRYMLYKAFIMYRKRSMRFTLPIIILSTITGTANFAQQSFPRSIVHYVPISIGGLNIITAIMTTVMQFLKVNELMEGYRSSSIQFGKLSRTIRLELSLPIKNRNQHGHEFLELCKNEYDRLIEQCPPIPSNIIKSFEKDFPGDSFIFKPEIIKIKPIETYMGSDEDNKIELKENLQQLRNSNFTNISYSSV